MSTAPLPLSQLLRLAFGAAPVWLNGQPSADPKIEWVSVALDEVRPGDLLLLDAGGGGPAVCGRAEGSGAAGVLLLGAERPKLDGFIGGGQAGAVNLPIAWLPDAGGVRPAQQLLIMLLVNQRAALIERGVRIYAQLSQLAAEGSGLGDLVRSIARLSTRGVLVQDKRLELLADCPSSTLAGVWDEALLSMRTPEMLPEPLRDRKQAGRQGGILRQELPGGLARLMAPVVAGEVARGYLSLVGLSQELDALDQLVLEQGALVCAVEMSRLKAVREAEKRMKGDLLSALLQEDLSPRDAGLWVEAMGLNLEQAHVAVRFAWDAPESPSRRRLETLVNGQVAHRGLKAIVHPMGVELVAFCEVEADAARPEAALALAQAVADEGEREHPDVPVRAGIGAPAAGLESWRLSFRQAGQALELARRLGERRPLYYADLSVYRLLLQIEHSPELIAFLEETIGSLLAHESAAELVHTLESYFAHNGNLSQTAEALYIHRNTLLYRMERIATIIGLDLDIPETRLAVQLALHIRKMMGARPG